MWHCVVGEVERNLSYVWSRNLQDYEQMKRKLVGYVIYANKLLKWCGILWEEMPRTRVCGVK